MLNDKIFHEIIAESAIIADAASARPAYAPSNWNVSTAVESPLASTSVESLVLKTLKPARNE